MFPRSTNIILGLLVLLSTITITMQPTLFANTETAIRWHYLSAVLYQGQRLRWDFSNHSPFTVCMRVPPTPTDIDRQLEPLVIEALQQWITALPSNQRTTLDWTQQCQHAQLQINMVPTIDTQFHAKPSSSSTVTQIGFTAAITAPVFNTTTNKLQSMNMTVALNKPTGKPLSELLLKSVLLHEVGHAFGLLGHSPNPNDVMAVAYYNKAGVTAKQILSPADKATLQALYTQPAQWSNLTSTVQNKPSQTLVQQHQAQLITLRQEAKTVGLPLQWQNLGGQLLWLGQQKQQLSEAIRTAYLQEAVTAFQTSLQLKPTVATASGIAIQLAQTYQLLKQLPAAQAVLSTAIKTNPTCTNCYLEQAWIFAKLQQWTLAKQALLHARQTNTNVVTQPAYQKIEHYLLTANPVF
jgi:predicted Zn-dependent protease